MKVLTLSLNTPLARARLPGGMCIRARGLVVGGFPRKEEGRVPLALHGENSSSVR